VILAANNIYLHPHDEPLPEHIAELDNYVGRNRDSPGPSLDQVKQDPELNELWIGATEAKVEDYSRGKIFPKYGSSDSVNRAEKQPMARCTVPNSSSDFKVSTPVPDLCMDIPAMGHFLNIKTN
jgi:hypothetical protein